MPAIVPDERRGGISPGDGGSSPELRVDAVMYELKDEDAKPAMKLVVRGEVRVIVVELCVKVVVWNAVTTTVDPVDVVAVKS